MAVMVSELDRLRRAFVCLLLALARKYQVKVLGLTRDSLAAVLEKAYRRVILKCHPDKGGSGVDQVRLNDARDLWKAAARAPRARGRPPPAAGTMALPGDARRRQETHRDARKRFDERTTPPDRAAKSCENTSAAEGVRSHFDPSVLTGVRRLVFGRDGV